eukprot:3693548-Pyramimonas_sp.AAC.1
MSCADCERDTEANCACSPIAARIEPTAAMRRRIPAEPMPRAPPSPRRQRSNRRRGCGALARRAERYCKA